MISQRKTHIYLERQPRFNDMMLSLKATARVPKGMIRETEEVVALARKFTDEVVRPNVSNLDLTMHSDPEYLDWEYVKKANDMGLYTLFIPRALGGKGYNISSMAYFLEEIGSACVAMSNLVGVHYLGVDTLGATWNARLLKRIFHDVREGERTGNPCLLSLATTEPNAGTDVEEVDLVERGKIGCRAERVKGGYKLNGMKCFISNGHLSTWHIVIAYADTKKPAESVVVLAVKTGTPGFSFGRMEHKMGQKACPASELIFEDCFVPDNQVGIDPEQMRKLSRSPRETYQQMIDYVVSTSRACVSAFGVSVARGAFEQALRFATETMVDGQLLINHEWAQVHLAEMYRNVLVGRLAYEQANYANDLYGFYKWFTWKPAFYFLKYVPEAIIDKVIAPMLDHPLATWLLRKLQFDLQTDAEFHCTSGWASLAKVTGTDAGLANGRLALELMGKAGVRHDQRAEKFLRDSKLLQIYEGTNQLNRINMLKCFIGSAHPEIRVFDEEG